MRMRRPLAAVLLQAMGLALLSPAAATAAGPVGLPTCPKAQELAKVTRVVRDARGHRASRKRVWVCRRDRHPPTRPRNLVAVPADGNVVVRWDAAQDAGGVAGYEVYRDGRWLATINDTTFTDPSLRNGVAHQYRVRAVDMARNLSGLSGVVWAMPRAVPDTVAPAMVAGLTAKGDANALSVALAWQPGADDKGVVSYRVYRDGALVGTTATPAYTDTGLGHRAEYKYTVTALDAAGNLSPACPPVSTYVS